MVNGGSTIFRATNGGSKKLLWFVCLFHSGVVEIRFTIHGQYDNSICLCARVSADIVRKSIHVHNNAEL
jgi:hypothetical protein